MIHYNGVISESPYHNRMLQMEMWVNPGESVTLLLVDNQSSIKLAKNPVFHKRSKHIAIRFHS